MSNPLNRNAGDRPNAQSVAGSPMPAPTIPSRTDTPIRGGGSQDHVVTSAPIYEGNLGRMGRSMPANPTWPQPPKQSRG